MNVTTESEVQTSAISTMLAETTEAVASGITSVMTSSATSTYENISSNIVEATTHLFDTYSVFIHPHWRKFPIVEDGWHYLIGIYITFVGFTGILGNVLVIYIFSRERSLRTPSNMLLVNLAISDMTFSLVNGFPLLSISAFSRKWIFGQAACEFYGLIGGIFGLMSINTMLAIAIDRYYAIAKPLEVAKNMSRKKAFYMIVVVWLWSLGSAVPPVFGWGRYIPEGFQTSCTFDYLTRTDNNRSYILFLYIFGFVIPLTIIIICYTMILKAVHVHEIEMKKTAKKLNAEMRSNQDKTRMEIRVAKIAISILVLYLLSWTPYALVALIGQFGDAMFVTPLWSEIPVMFAKTSAIYNPLVYALSHPKFRIALSKRLPWLCCAVPVPTTGASSTFRRDASKRSASSMTGISVDMESEMSNISDGPYMDMELRLRRLEEDIQNKETRLNSRRKAIKGKSIDGNTEELTHEKIIQDLSKALIDIAARERSPKQNIQPVYLPSSILKKKSADGKGGESPSGGDNVFVLDSNTLPQLASYLAKFSNLNSETGIANPAYDLSPDAPKIVVGHDNEQDNRPGQSNELKARSKNNTNNLNIEPDNNLKEDEERL